MNLDKFLCWFNSTGVITENVNVCYSDSSGFGLYSRRSLIEKNSLVLSIPENLFIKPSFENNNLTGFEHLIIYLLEEKSNPYVNFLRSIQPIPQWCLFSNDKYPRQLLDKMKKHLNKYNLSRIKIQQYNDDQFQWAYYIINTRCVHFPMDVSSKDQDNNLCLIPYLDFVNHSIEPNTMSNFNSLTRSYEIRTIKPIDINEQITFLYNPHPNVDLFIEYGFVLTSNLYNQLNIENELEQILSNEKIQIIQSLNYWNSLELYSGDNDLSWTVIKTIELTFNQDRWSPYDDPSIEDKCKLKEKLKQLLTNVKQNIEKDFQQWVTNYFHLEKNILYNDFLTIIQDTSIIVNKSFIEI
ncbi:unnamed protein product [Rotaria magnacalcarata]|uniref:SET domain-containing protein n=2 Tax=Rotaria magnacalcarata TaxID=392030 RepID=A0A815N749_9BILA|nr:unnamed protein product [Rotaria magnacalcarata]CAF1604640.1 unnamed protein product [Rotaria magnacalcarata]CAF1979260.1 unnamed protein product [Rotaria magnacalcarata]CAF3775912.1 unnamed protein product [Rotaria magnacalcarata]CAF3817240.1 unnamed protein product [Rotaria magnacalcarata]